MDFLNLPLLSVFIGDIVPIISCKEKSSFFSFYISANLLIYIQKKTGGVILLYCIQKYFSLQPRATVASSASLSHSLSHTRNYTILFRICCKCLFVYFHLGSCRRFKMSDVFVVCFRYYLFVSEHISFNFCGIYLTTCLHIAEVFSNLRRPDRCQKAIVCLVYILRYMGVDSRVKRILGEMLRIASWKPKIIIQ